MVHLVKLPLDILEPGLILDTLLSRIVLDLPRLIDTATIVLQVVSNVSILIELPAAIAVVSFVCSTVFWAFLISISLVLASSALIASACIFWRLSMIACASACLNTGSVMINAELIFLTRFMLENSIALIIGMDCIATLSAVRRSCVRCSSIISAWFRLVSSNWIDVSPVVCMSDSRCAM